ncbi:SseB family protein [Fluviicola sp.]|uniref:SseB family protein n=1 Tax=Fluviicola sp. TaxID=1917219 RepID=UPI0031D88312
MGLLDLFKKKKNRSSFPENELEQCLMQASSDVAAQKEFYQKLLWSQLVVLTDKNPDMEDGIHTLEKNTQLRLVTFENGYIPVFTSPNRIFDNGIVKEEVPVMGIKGQDLFGVAKGATFVLNPYSDYVKELLPEEIENLMNGTIYDKIDAYEAEKDLFERFNQLFKEAGKKQEGLIALDGYHLKKLSAAEKSRLEDSVNGFRKCLELVPDNWQSMFLMGKALQRLERHADALEQMEAAFKLEPSNPALPMEASLEAMHLKNLDKALFYSEESLRIRPNDYALMGNHAMNLLLAQRDAEAQNMIQEALSMQPDDTINQNIDATIKDVISGKRPRPAFEDTIK